jgi:hypothetical protein
MVGKVTKCRVFDGQKIIFQKDSAPLTTDHAATHDANNSITVADINRMNEEFWGKHKSVEDEAALIEYPQTLAEINAANENFWGRA